MTKSAWMTSLALVALLLSAAGIAASPQAYPSRPVRLLIGYAPGGSDIPGRMLAQRLAERFGQPFLIDNRPGAARYSRAISPFPPPSKGVEDYPPILDCGSCGHRRVLPEAALDPIRIHTRFASRLRLRTVTHPSSPRQRSRIRAVARAGQLNHMRRYRRVSAIAQALFCKQRDRGAPHRVQGPGPALIRSSRARSTSAAKSDRASRRCSQAKLDVRDSDCARTTLDRSFPRLRNSGAYSKRGPGMAQRAARTAASCRPAAIRGLTDTRQP